MRGASILGLAAGAVLAFAAGAAAQSEAERPLMPADVKFKRLPNFGATAFYFPPSARMKRVEGRATVICRVQPDGGLGDCAVAAEAPEGEGFGEATTRLAAEEIVMEKKARDGSATAGRLFQFTRIYALPGSAGTKQTMPLDLGEVGEDGLRRRWIQSPETRAFDRCFRKVINNFQDVEITLTCKSAPNDRLTDCRVVKNSRAPDGRYETAGLCAIQTGRYRVEDADGRPVAGVEVTTTLSRLKQ